MCNEREELEKLEEDQLAARKNALHEDFEFMRKKKEEELEPRLQALKVTTEDMKVKERKGKRGRVKEKKKNKKKRRRIKREQTINIIIDRDTTPEITALPNVWRV